MMHSTLSDDELLKLLRAGDENAFVTLYRRRQGALYRFALRMSGSEAVAEDVTQEVFMTLMRGENNYDPSRGSFSAYLFGVARNQVLRRLEKDRVLSPIQTEEDEAGTLTPEGLIAVADPLGDLTRKEMIASVRQAVLALPAHYREVVVLCDLQELSYVDAAMALGCAVGTVRSRLHRARALLVDKLRSHQIAAANGTARAPGGIGASEAAKADGVMPPDTVNCFV
jgi:RNA polymerase sigma-70 factor (ECF subfamily)